MRTLKIWFDKHDNHFNVVEKGQLSKHPVLEFEKPLKVSFVYEPQGGGYAYVELAI